MAEPTVALDGGALCGEAGGVGYTGFVAPLTALATGAALAALATGATLATLATGAAWATGAAVGIPFAAGSPGSRAPW